MSKFVLYLNQKAALKNFTIFTGKHLCWSLSLIKLQAATPATLLKKNPTQVFSCEYFEIFKNIYYKEHLQAAASVSISLLDM